MSDPYDPLNPPIVPTPGGQSAPRQSPDSNLIGGGMSSQAVGPVNSHTPLPPEMMEILAILGQIMQYKNGAGQLQGIFGGGDYRPPAGPPVPIVTSGSTQAAPVPGPTPGPTATPQGIAAPPAAGLQGIFGGGTGAPVGTPDVGTEGGFQEALARRRGMGAIQ